MIPKKWSDKPYYETGYQPPEDKPKDFTNRYYRKTDTSPSPLMGWYHGEARKRSQGLENDLDLADIKAAMKGSRNFWSAAVKKFPEKFDVTQAIVWDEIVGLKNLC